MSENTLVQAFTRERKKQKSLDSRAFLRMKEEIANLIYKEFNELPSRIIRKRDGSVNKVYLVETTNHGKLIVRTHTNPYHMNFFENSAAILELLKQYPEIPAPLVLSLGVVENKFVYLIQEYIPGTTAAEFNGDSSEFWKSLAKIVKEFNQIKCKKFGPLTKFPGENYQQFDSWNDFLDNFKYDYIETGFLNSKNWKDNLKKVKKDLKKEGLIDSEETFELIDPKNLSKKIEALKSENVEPSLVHGNLDKSNIILNNKGEVVGVIDWDKAVMQRSPHYEIASTFPWINKTERQMFLRGYGLTPKKYQLIKKDVDTLQAMVILKRAVWHIKQGEYENLKETLASLVKI